MQAATAWVRHLRLEHTRLRAATRALKDLPRESPAAAAADMDGAAAEVARLMIEDAPASREGGGAGSRGDSGGGTPLSSLMRAASFVHWPAAS